MTFLSRFRPTPRAGTTPQKTANPDPKSAAAPGAAPKPKIEVKWDTAQSYSFQCQSHPLGASLHDMPKGWPDPDKGPEIAPKRMENVPRHDPANPIPEGAAVAKNQKSELGHYMDEYGRTKVQTKLLNVPSLTRRLSEGELHVKNDFSESILQATRLSRGKQSPKKGEFLATYSWIHDPDSGERRLERTAFKFEKGDSIAEPDTDVKPDYIIHSHPFDPRNPGGYSLNHPLGSNSPSGADRDSARTPYEEVDGSTSAPPKEMLLHGDQVFHTHAHDLNFSLLDPAAPEVGAAESKKPSA